MILYFNKNGQLLESLEYGSSARVGDTQFQIFAYFEDLTDEHYTEYSTAMIRFKKPDRQGSEYPDMFMVQSTLVYDDEVEASRYFSEDNNPYYGFKFDFDSVTSNGEKVRLLDVPGMWEASITLYKSEDSSYVTGLVRFFVEGAVYEDDDDLYDPDISVIINNIRNLLIDNYVPYRGANSNIDLGNHNLSVFEILVENIYYAGDLMISADDDLILHAADLTLNGDYVTINAENGMTVHADGETIDFYAGSFTWNGDLIATQNWVNHELESYATTSYVDGNFLKTTYNFSYNTLLSNIVAQVGAGVPFIFKYTAQQPSEIINNRKFLGIIASNSYGQIHIIGLQTNSFVDWMANMSSSITLGDVMSHIIENATQSWVSSSYLQKNTDSNPNGLIKFYAVNSSGQQTMAYGKKEYNGPGSVVLRRDSGAVYVPTNPSDNNDATSKKYVDDKDAQNVKLTGNQTIAGTKTFSSSPIVPAPTNDTDAVNKSYVDTTSVRRTTDSSLTVKQAYEMFGQNAFIHEYGGTWLCCVSEFIADEKYLVDMLDLSTYGSNPNRYSANTSATAVGPNTTLASIRISGTYDQSFALKSATKTYRHTVYVKLVADGTNTVVGDVYLVIYSQDSRAINMWVSPNSNNHGIFNANIATGYLRGTWEGRLSPSNNDAIYSNVMYNGGGGTIICNALDLTTGTVTQITAKTTNSIQWDSVEEA